MKDARSTGRISYLSPILNGRGLVLEQPDFVHGSIYEKGERERTRKKDCGKGKEPYLHTSGSRMERSQ